MGKMALNLAMAVAATMTLYYFEPEIMNSFKRLEAGLLFFIAFQVTD